MGEHENTLRWFGESWGAPVCDPETQVPIPAGELCYACQFQILPATRGVVVPVWLSVGWVVGRYHLSCWLRIVGVPLAFRPYDRTPVPLEDPSEPV